MTKFYKLIFFNSLIMGSLMTLSSYSWMIMWMGLEINLMSFIPLILASTSIYSSESTMKYFMVQAIASTMMIFSIIMLESSLSLSYFDKLDPSMILLYSALLMKLGMSPFHSWFPEVMEGLSWSKCLLLLTWQKIAPMSMIFMTISNSNLLIASIIFSSMMGSIMGFNQTSMRKIMAYSSINHMAWMMMSMFNSVKLWMIYFSIYSITNIWLIIYFSMMKIFQLNQINITKISKMSKLVMMMNFLSLAGLPPLIGFLPKWMVISLSVENNMMFLPTILIISTLVSIYFYLRILFPMMMIKSTNLKIKFYNLKFNYMTMMVNLIFLFMLPISNLMF